MNCIAPDCHTGIPENGLYCEEHQTKCCDCGELIMQTKGDCPNGCARKALSGADVELIEAAFCDGKPPAMRVLGRLIVTTQVLFSNLANACREVTLANERVDVVERELARVREQLGAYNPQSAYKDGVQMACTVVVGGKLHTNANHDPWYDVKLQVPNHPSITCTVCRLCGVIYKPE